MRIRRSGNVAALLRFKLEFSKEHARGRRHAYTSENHVLTCSGFALAGAEGVGSFLGGGSLVSGPRAGAQARLSDGYSAYVFLEFLHFSFFVFHLQALCLSHFLLEVCSAQDAVDDAF